MTPVPSTPVLKLRKMGYLPQGGKGEDVEMLGISATAGDKSIVLIYLDLETQPGYIESEAIESFGSQIYEGRSKDEISSVVDNGLDCECGIKVSTGSLVMI